jgi:hypothetical protein
VTGRIRFRRVEVHTVYRNPSVLIASSLGIVAAVLIGLLGGTAKHGQVTSLVLAALLLGFCVRLGRAGIRVKPDGVKVVGLLTASPELLWTDIDHFAVKPFGQYPAVARVDLKDAREYSCLAIGSVTKINPSVKGSMDRVERTVEELNVLLRGKTTPAPTSDPSSLQGFLDRLE